jgi:hypothetical protein
LLLNSVIASHTLKQRQGSGGAVGALISGVSANAVLSVDADCQEEYLITVCPTDASAYAILALAEDLSAQILKLRLLILLTAQSFWRKCM